MVSRVYKVYHTFWNSAMLLFGDEKSYVLDFILQIIEYYTKINFANS